MKMTLKTYSRARKDNYKTLTNHKAQGLFLADALASDQDLINGGNFGDPLATWALPVYNGTVLGRQESLSKDVVGYVRKSLEALFQAGELDALSNDLSGRVVDVDVAEPQVCRGILCFQASIRIRCGLLYFDIYQ